MQRENNNNKVIRVLGKNKEHLGEMSFRQGMKMARELNLDLVLINKNTDVPVYRIMDKGKYDYEQKKKLKEKQKNNKQLDSKTVRLLPNIGDHDLQTKIRHIQAWLEEGRIVRIEMKFKGRMIVHKDIGKKVLETIMDAVGVHQKVKMEGNTMICQLRLPKK